MSKRDRCLDKHAGGRISGRNLISSMRVFVLLGVAMISAIGADGDQSAAAAIHCNLMPLPAKIAFQPGRLTASKSFSVSYDGYADNRLRKAVGRMEARCSVRTGFPFGGPGSKHAARSTLVIRCGGPGNVIPRLGDDETYSLNVTPDQAILTTHTVIGAMRGLATLTQLLRGDRGDWFWPAVRIEDHPRFPWRGLMIDVCRHWQPMAVIERNLDAMELVKLNVLHLHLTDDQGFRIESKTHPELQGKGSDGHYFTQAQMKEIIAYATARGIRVVPEFDIPGHATSWVVSHPELASLPGPYQIERQWGVFNPVLDPTKPAVYKLLNDFLGEMAALFPDEYIHIGGDENNGVQWNANPHIQAFIREHGLKDDAGLHAYFNRRVAAILGRYGKKMVGWDEILNPDLPKTAVIDSWRGPKGLASAARQGFRAILSHGFYIDLCYPAAKHYLNDPLPADSTLTPAQRQLVLGGEATMWSEWVSPETIDSRIWPRTAAIAERLWSPANVRNVADMYRRLAIVNRRLSEAGTLQLKNERKMLFHLVSPNIDAKSLTALNTFVRAVEPVKHYERGKLQPWSNQLVPLIGLADAAHPESVSARKFRFAVNRFLFGPSFGDTGLAEKLEAQLTEWQSAGESVSTDLVARYPALRQGAPLAAALAKASATGEQALNFLVTQQSPPAGWLKKQFSVLDAAAVPSPSACELPELKSIRLLVAAAGITHRPVLPDPDWRSAVDALAFPKNAATPK